MVPLTQPKTRLSFLAVVNADARAFEGFLPALLALCETGGRRAYWTLLARRGALESPWAALLKPPGMLRCGSAAFMTVSLPEA